MRRPAPTLCPACSGPLHVVRLGCEACGTAVEGDFDNGKLGRLGKEQLAFALVFLECRGKIKDVEERLGLSYPTVVARLDEVVAALQPDAPTKKIAAPRSRTAEDILEALAKGEIDTAQAAARLRAQKKGESSG